MHNISIKRRDSEPNKPKEYNNTALIIVADHAHNLGCFSTNAFAYVLNIKTWKASAIINPVKMLSKDIEGYMIATDHLFCKNTWISTTETDIKKISHLYEVWYKDWMRYFKKFVR